MNSFGIEFTFLRLIPSQVDYDYHMNTKAMDQINTSFYQQQNYGYPNVAADEVWYVDIGK